MCINRLKADIEYLENSRVTEITHDWLNFGYEFVSSRSVSNANQKACINLLQKTYRNQIRITNQSIRVK